MYAYAKFDTLEQKTPVWVFFNVLFHKSSEEG